MRRILLLVISLTAAVAFSQSAGSFAAEKENSSTCFQMPVGNSSQADSNRAVDLCNGVAVLDYAGEAWVTLPDGYDVRGGDLRYQLTPMGKASPNLHLANELTGNRFRIAGGRMKQKVSWQVIVSRPADR